MNTPLKSKFVEVEGLLLIHDPYVDAVEVDLLPEVLQILYCRLPFGIGKEVIVKNLYPFAVGVQLNWLDRVNCPLLIVYQAERTPAYATTRKDQPHCEFLSFFKERQRFVDNRSGVGVRRVGNDVAIPFLAVTRREKIECFDVVSPRDYVGFAYLVALFFQYTGDMSQAATRLPNLGREGFQFEKSLDRAWVSAIEVGVGPISRRMVACSESRVNIPGGFARLFGFVGK